MGAALTIAVAVASIVGRFLLAKPDFENLALPLRPPSGAHLFGTDDVGRDVLSRTLAATWLDLGLSAAVTAASLSIGVLAGTIAGYVGGWIERVIMRLTDLVIAFPVIVIVIAIIATVGPGIPGLYVALVGVGWTFYARFSRAEMLALREKQFVQAARTLGYSNRRVLLRHAVPNVLRPCVVYAMSDIVLNIVFIAALSYLGLGVQPPAPEWGSIISEGQGYIVSAWWITTFPGIVVVIVGIGFTLVGDGLAERLGTSRVDVVR